MVHMPGVAQGLQRRDPLAVGPHAVLLDANGSDIMPSPDRFARRVRGETRRYVGDWKKWSSECSRAN